MSEDFLSRWSRLKRESGAGPADRGAAHTSESAAPPPDATPAPAIDLSSLPAIESINADSNVALFLQDGVPEDLTRAALRSAWVSDPAIRDFVGIAENQWDFNGEGTIPGFGSLSAEEYARYVAARALQAAGATDEHPSSGASGRPDSAAGSPLPSASASPTQSHTIARPPVGESQVKPAIRACASAKRTHGTALPK